MNTEFFIAKRIFSKDKGNFSRPIVNIAIISIALGLAAMIISVAITMGFQTAIRNKIIGFGSHIRINKYDLNSSYQTIPVDKNQKFYPYLDTVKGIRHIQVYAIKAGIIKTKEQIYGVVLKGIASDYDWSFFKKKIIKGKPLIVNDSIKINDIVISKYIADKLKLKLNDDVVMYFIQDPPRMRKFKISGIYETGLEEYDKIYALVDIAHIQKLNAWTKNQVSGFEVLIDDFDDLDKMGKYVYNNIGYDLNSKTIKELNVSLFDWLNLQNTNVFIILVMVILVAAITIISTLLILILEKTNMIGILKSLGVRNWSVRKIFIYNAEYIIGKGILWGNIIGIAICLLQKKFEIFTLNQESYYVSVVPIDINLLNILMINLGTIFISVLILIIPSYIISRITPIKAIRYD